MVGNSRALPTICSALSREGIPFVLVGGAALTLYGSPRACPEMDIAIKAIDVDRVVDLAYRLGLRLVLGVDREQHPLVATAPEAALVFLGDSRRGFMKFLATELEVNFVYNNPVPFMRLYAMSTRMTIGGTAVRLASLEHLKAMKSLSVTSGSDEERVALDRLDLAFIEKKLREGGKHA